MIGKVEKEVAKASSLMEGVEAEIGKKRAVSRKVGGWVGGWVGWQRRCGCARLDAMLQSQCAGAGCVCCDSCRQTIS